jgi:hypothetical protein
MSLTKYLRGACKCCCNNGAIVPRWQNLTKTRPPGDTGGTHYTATPAPRLDADFAISNGDSCTPVGVCGSWYSSNGDLLAMSAQEIQATVNDIMTCAGTDATHNTTDHNCYFKNGDSVNMQMAKRFGGQWIFARKFWHGAFGFLSTDAPGVPHDPTQGPDQTKYLTATYSANYTWMDKVIWGNNVGTVSTNRTAVVGSRSVARTTGIITNGVSVHEVVQTRWENGCDSQGNSTFIIGQIEDHTNCVGTSTHIWPTDTDTSAPPCPFTYTTQTNVNPTTRQPDIAADLATMPYNLTDIPMVDQLIAFWNEAFPPVSPALPVSKGTNPNGFSLNLTSTSLDGAGNPYTLSLSVSRSNTSYSWNIAAYLPEPDPDGQNLNYFGSITLSNPYTAQECYQDFLTALGQWNLSDFTLSALRTDENLAHAPCVMFDEVGATSPLGFNCSMDDYSVGLVNDENNNTPASAALTPEQAATQNNDDVGSPPSSPIFQTGNGQQYIPTWAQTAWQDPNNYVWQAPDGQYFQTASGTALPDGSASGATLITPLRNGSIVAHTTPGSDRHFWFGAVNYARLFDENSGSTWIPQSYGNFSDTALCPLTMRWLAPFEEQYDGEQAGGTPLPGNYPQAFFRQDAREGSLIVGGKFVQAVQDWPAVNFTRPCGNDKWLVDQTTVCCITASASGSFTVTAAGVSLAPGAAGGLAVGNNIISDDPTYGGVYQITGISGSGPWTISVGSKLASLPAGFSLVSAGEAGDGMAHLGRQRFPSAAATCGSETPQHTGVYLNWTFNQRQAALPTGSQPNWLQGTGAGTGTGIVGCLSYSVTQFTYPASTCKAIAGIVPFYAGSPVENFKNQVLFPFPSSATFDDSYGAHWQAAVMLSMPDPFWQAPFKPNCDGATFGWAIDDGSGNLDTATTRYFPAAPLVEALSNIPAGDSLPAGVTLFYAPSNIQPPPYYPNGIPYQSDVSMDWGFTLRACGNIAAGGRFSNDYAPFVNCADV